MFEIKCLINHTMPSNDSLLECISNMRTVPVNKLNRKWLTRSIIVSRRRLDKNCWTSLMGTGRVFVCASGDSIKGPKLSPWGIPACAD